MLSITTNDREPVYLVVEHDDGTNTVVATISVIAEVSNNRVLIEAPKELSIWRGSMKKRKTKSGALVPFNARDITHKAKSILIGIREAIRQ